MTKKKLIAVIVLFLMGITGLRFLWISIHPLPLPLKAVQGVLDLRDTPFSDDKIYSLRGEWEIYPGKLLPSGSRARSAPSPGTNPSYIQVPGSWKGAMKQEQETYRYASYRLRILTKQPDQRIGIILPKINSSSALYVNGKIEGHSGIPAETAQEYTARAVPYPVYFNAVEGETELVLQVADFDTDSGGILRPVLFGNSQTIHKERLLTIGMELAVCIVLLLHAAYAVILYLIIPRHKVLLYFTLMVVFATFSILSDDDRLLMLWLPISNGWSLKLLRLAFLGTFFFMLLLAKQLLFPNERFKWMRILAIITLLFGGLLISVPSSSTLFSVLSHQYGHLLLSLAVGIFIIIYKSFIRNEEGTIFLLLAITSIISSTIWGSIKNNSTLGLSFYPFDLIFAFLAFATFWFRRFFWNAEQTAKLAVSLQRSIKQKDDFLANTSHELQNPLHGIINIAEAVLSSEKSTLHEQNAEDLRLLITVGRRMSLLLNDLLDLSQLREHNIQLKLESLRIQSAASGVMDMLRFMTGDKPLELKMDIPDNFPNVIGDEKRVIQILFNLLQNAVKYTEKGTVSVYADIHQQTARIHIMDTGIGMDQETQRRVFEPYEQGDSSMTAMGGGIGLGLSICKELVQLHGGSLSVVSSPQEGSVFTFTLQLAGEPQESVLKNDVILHESGEAPLVPYALVQDHNIVDSDSQSKSRVLAVDDDPVNLKILTALLADDYEIMTVTSGHGALLLLDDESWDLVISDVMMPGMSGYELTRRIRERYSVTELPVLLLTARNQPQDIYTGFVSGANDYVSKPVNAMELQMRVRFLTDLKQSVSRQLRVEAAYLQAQIQPHFLFNTLNSISALASFDSERMSDLIDAFSSYLRLSFNFLNAEPLVPLERELELVRAYLYIEKERFDDRLETTWSIEPDLHFLLPPLTIQPLVENAVRHGILNRAKGGRVEISVRKHSEGYKVTIADNGIGIRAEVLSQLLTGPLEPGRGIGLQNTHKRLMRMYGRGLTIESTVLKGTIISFIIPFSKSQASPGAKNIY
ncbi:Sensor histidine kinase RcsC [Paenibacillus auburnensis]|uniref:histidine kinase n=1 Tax=Paenibacillus auburnensis TaxID=2905649 RepID=A0ABM9CNN6_9BACL|nr:ATP-binding protein [Paenibacillus auburnensis]CAH1217920.1 Sensor histidine kinase RcsC [Paenibacillus auburnensis]